ncbi:MAG: hypothetical protein IPO65_16710 [Saprospiraceae bacterium]|nr:hypothetical protein [Saprospiraceae bacterium]
MALFLSYFYLYFLLNKKSLFRGLFNAVLFIIVWMTEWFYLQSICDAYFFFAYTAGSLLLLSNVYVYIMDRLNSVDVAEIERSVILDQHWHPGFPIFRFSLSFLENMP